MAKIKAISTSQSQVLGIPIERIYHNPSQPREHFEEKGIQELAKSIETSGLLQPIAVRILDAEKETYELIAGERRLRAFRYLKKEEIPAIVLDIESGEARSLSLIENLQREDLTITEEADCLNALAMQYNGDLNEVGEKIGKPPEYIKERIALLNLPAEVKELLDKKEVNLSQAKVILELEDEKTQIEAAKLVVKLKLTANQLRGRMQKKIRKRPKREKVDVISFNQLSSSIVRLYDAVEKYDFSMLRDEQKKETLRKQIQITQRILSEALAVLEAAV